MPMTSSKEILMKGTVSRDQYGIYFTILLHNQSFKKTFCKFDKESLKKNDFKKCPLSPVVRRRGCCSQNYRTSTSLWLHLLCAFLDKSKILSNSRPSVGSQTVRFRTFWIDRIRTGYDFFPIFNIVLCLKAIKCVLDYIWIFPYKALKIKSLARSL